MTRRSLCAIHALSRHGHRAGHASHCSRSNSISVPAVWQVEVEFQATLSAVQQKIPAYHGKLTETPSGVLFQTHHNHLLTLARFLISLNLPFIILNPPELREAFLQLAEEAGHIAKKGR